MLSKKELEFLLKGGTGNPDYDRVMRHRIRAKLLRFEREALPTLKANDWSKQWLFQILLSATKNCNDVTEFRNASENQNSVLNAPFAENWRPGRDLNPRRRLDRPTCLASGVWITPD